MVTALASLFLTVGLLLLALRALRLWSRRAEGHGRGLPLELLQRIPTGPRQGIALVRVGDRVLVVSLAEGGARFLTELDEDTALEAMSEPVHDAPNPLWRGIAARIPALARIGLALAFLMVPAVVTAQGTPTAPAQNAVTAPVDSSAAPSTQLQVSLDEGNGEIKLSGAVGLVVFMGLLTLLPAVVLTMTGFTRILVVLHFLRSALGTPATPPGQLLVAIALLLTGVVMAPTLDEANRTALQPYMDGEISQTEAYQQAMIPLRRFMLANTGDRELATMVELTKADTVATFEELPTTTVTAAFITSELKAAFQIGFVIFLPFIVLDLIVASVLMSLGMFMLPPVMISLPFKLLLFVLADGWNLIVQNLVMSFAR